MLVVPNTPVVGFIAGLTCIYSTTNWRQNIMVKEKNQCRTKKGDRKGLSCRLLEIPNELIILSIVDSKVRGKTKSTCVDYEAKLIPDNIQCTSCAIDAVSRHIFGTSIMEGVERYRGPSRKAIIYFDQFFAIP